MQWYYTSDGEQHGPVEENRLFWLAKKGELKPSDHVWNKSMGEKWQLATAVHGLFPDEPDAPPPLPSRGVAIGDGAISCTAPVGPAWHCVLSTLFKPFEIGRWFTLGFMSWVAYMGQRIGMPTFWGNFNTAGDRGLPDLSDIDFSDGRELVEVLRLYIQQNVGLIAASATGGVVLALAVWLVLLWVRSRMKFVFLDNIVNDGADLKEPWGIFAQHGNSLFVFSLLFGLVRFFLSLAFFGLAYAGVLQPLLKHNAFGPAVPGLIVLVLLSLIVQLPIGYVSRFLEDFVVPLMYKQSLTVTEAWSVFLREIWKEHRGKLLLYGLFWYILALGAGACLSLLGVVTCDIGCCLMWTPYIGAVVTIPVPVFLRAYSIEYLRQFGPDYSLEAEMA